jgi:predicted permease
VVFQVALSTVLLSSSVLLLRSMERLLDTELGFNPTGILTADLPLPTSKYPEAGDRAQFFRTFLDELEMIPGVQAASLVNMIPLRDRYQNWAVFDPENPPADRAEGISAYARSVTPGYFEVMGIPLLAGQDHQDLGEDTPLNSLIISQEMGRRLFPGQEPIGRQVAIGSVENPWIREVVGVVGDIRMTTVDQAPFPQMYFNYPSLAYATMQLVVRTDGDPHDLVQPIRRALLNKDPDVPLNQISTMPEIVSESLRTNRVMGVMITLFSLIALFLSVVGLHGVLAFSVAKRTREIGVRMAVGAGAQAITKMILKQGMVLVVAGLALGVAGALAGTRVIRSLLFEVEPTDPRTYVGVMVAFLIIGAVACLLPARSAIRVDPVRAFQAE